MRSARRAVPPLKGPAFRGRLAQGLAAAVLLALAYSVQAAVRDVRNHLQVGLDPTAATPYNLEQSDRAIRDDIRDELRWSPVVDADRVTVTVFNGVATLTGVVDTLNEAQAAVENAIQGGARHVINNLKIGTFSEPRP